MGRGRYADLIEPELWSYIDRVNTWFPPQTAAPTMEEQRAIYNRMCADFHPGRPEGVAMADAVLAADGRGIPVRRYRLAGATPVACVVYYHGGGFVFGNLDSHDDVCAEICGRTGFDVVSVDYRLAPEHLHPAHFEDALDAYDLLSTGSDLPIVLVGESAGGALAPAVAWMRRGEGNRIIGQVLIYPGMAGKLTGRSYLEHAEAPLLRTEEVTGYRAIRTGGAFDERDPRLSPLSAHDFTGLPPTAIFTAEFDPVSSDGEAYRDRIVAAGGLAYWHEEPRLVHSYLRARPTVARARLAFTRIVEAIDALGHRRWPFAAR
jgi:acetyl esterase